MDSGIKKIIYYLGIVAALYLLFAFVLPIVFGVIGFTFKILFYVFIMAAIAYIVFMLVVHLIKHFNKGGR